MEKTRTSERLFTSPTKTAASWVPDSFTAKYRAWRLVYYEEYGDAEAAHDRERQLKGWSRAKKNALVEKMNPKWRDIITEWENNMA